MPTPPADTRPPDPEATELARAQRRIAELEQALQALRADHDAFSYAVSHDLRSPLRHITGHIELFQHQVAVEDGSKAAKYLGTVTSAAERLGRMLDGLLQHSRIGRADLLMRPVDMAALVGDVRAALPLKTPDRAIDWQIGALPPAAGDVLLLRDLWLHLLDNAVKFTARVPAARIAVSGETLPGEGRARYTVRDNGAGFDMAQAGKLFGVFQRLHLPREFDGIGMGLALARRIVERHGGGIRASAAPGAGCCVVFDLPLAPRPGT